VAARAGLVGEYAAVTAPGRTCWRSAKHVGLRRDRNGSRHSGLTEVGRRVPLRGVLIAMTVVLLASCGGAARTVTVTTSTTTSTASSTSTSSTSQRPATHTQTAARRSPRSSPCPPGEFPLKVPASSLPPSEVDGPCFKPPSTSAATTTTTAPSISTAQSAPAIEGPGSLSHATDAQFCSTHTCIENFPNGSGSIVQCADGEWSHSGGRSGACSDHGGER
jgi:hypothetical protein